MSRQSKNARNRSIAKQFSEKRKAGGSGPSRTTPAHGKVNTFRAMEKAKIAALLLSEASGKGKSKPSTTGRGSKYASKQSTGRKAA